MGLIVLASILGVLALAGIGVLVYNTIGPRRDSLTRGEREEYGRLLAMRQNIQMQAPEHIALGDSFARIALDEANATYRKRGNEL